MTNPPNSWEPDSANPAEQPAGGPTPTWYGSDPTGPPTTTPPHGIQFGDGPQGGWQYPSGFGIPSGDPAGAGGHGAGSGAGPGGPPFTVTTLPNRRRLWELVAVGGICAALASGCTYAATQDHSAATTTVGTSSAHQVADARPVVQADPKAPDWAAVAKAVSPSVVAISLSSPRGRAGEGSGVIIDTEGRIITNNHVVTAGGTATGLTLKVTLDDKRTFDAEIVGTDPATDLAVIKLKQAPNDLRPIAFGTTSELQVGDPVMAVGNPLGLAGTVTTGIVSALNRPVITDSDRGIDGSRGEPVVTNAVQTSAAINPGNSGGALVNASGQLIGINSAIASTSNSSGNIGIGFAIPVHEARSVSDQLVATGKAKHAYLGVSSVSAVVQDGSSQRAVAGIERVWPDTPAAKAGLEKGDAVVAVNGAPVDTSDSLVAHIRERTVNDKVTLTVVRDGQRRDVEITLTERPTTP